MSFFKPMTFFHTNRSCSSFWNIFGLSRRPHFKMTTLGFSILLARISCHWKPPKENLLCMTLHRLGHCDSYVFSLVLETLMATAVNTGSSILEPPSPFVFLLRIWEGWCFYEHTSRADISTYRHMELWCRRLGVVTRMKELDSSCLQRLRTRRLPFKVPRAKLIECHIGAMEEPKLNKCDHNATHVKKKHLRKQESSYAMVLISIA